MSPENSPVPDHIIAWARETGPSLVLADAFARFERDQSLVAGTCRVELTQEQRRQVGRILPATWAASGQAIRWRELRAGLVANDTTLESVVADRHGAWRNRTRERRDLQQANEQDHQRAVHTLCAVLRSRLGASDLPPDTEELVGRGLFGRRTTAEDAERIQHVMDGLPGEGDTVGLAVLAARVFGDAHALDRTTALGRAVARFVHLEALVRAGRPAPGGTVSFTPQGWRAAWAGVGVVCDQVSSQVLVLNLPLEGEAPAVAIATAAAGEPVWLTLRSMAGRMVIRGDVTTVFVCENPSIVEAAADALGAATHPLICTFGRPSAAALHLLGTIGPRTAIRVQADADATGRSIVEAILADHPTATPWRMPETGVVYEEELVEELLVDLQHPAIQLGD